MQQKGPLRIGFQQDFEEKTSAEDCIFSGEYHLLQGNLSEGLKMFKKAEKFLNNTRPDLYYRQGLALYEYGTENEHEKILSLANQKFKKAHLLDPTDPDILHAWGNLLTYLGEIREEAHFFYSAKNKIETVLQFGIKSPELYWDYGVIWYHIGAHSQEAIDLQQGLQAFEKALELQEVSSAEFWIDYGTTSLLLSTKIKDIRYVTKSVHCAKQAILYDQNSFESWNSLAEALEILYEYTHDEDHFSQANECFAKGSTLNHQDSAHWLQWAKFLLNSAKRTNDLKRVRQCLEKCHRAHAYDCENALILAIWAEALACLGQMTEKLDLIYEAENKIFEALELDENDPEIWHSLGMCFFSFGQYFNDHDYYYQAIEKFQEGLSIDRSYDPLWLAMANTYAKVGTLDENIETLTQSLKFYEKALALSETSTHHMDFACALSKLGELTHEERRLQQALWHFEMAFSLQKNALYLYPHWLFSYASTLDMMGDFHDEDQYYTRAIEFFSHVIMIDPNYPGLQHRIAQVFCHLGELRGEIDDFYRAIHHLRLALKQEEDNDAVILDWGIALIHIAHHTSVLTDVDQLMRDAEQKLTLAAKLGNTQGYYYLSCLHSLLSQHEKSLYFLRKSDHFHALPPIEDLLGDDWLEGLRSTPEFQEFIADHPHLHKEN